jgi:hypothetical protein
MVSMGTEPYAPGSTDIAYPRSITDSSNLRNALVVCHCFQDPRMQFPAHNGYLICYLTL